MPRLGFYAATGSPSADLLQHPLPLGFLPLHDLGLRIADQRIDVMTHLRGVAPFQELWARRKNGS